MIAGITESKDLYAIWNFGLRRDSILLSMPDLSMR
jgi:hypothetical protein